MSENSPSDENTTDDPNMEISLPPEDLPPAKPSTEVNRRLSRFIERIVSLLGTIVAVISLLRLIMELFV